MTTKKHLNVAEAIDLLDENQRAQILRTTLRNMRDDEVRRYADIKQAKGETTPLEDRMLDILHKLR